MWKTSGRKEICEIWAWSDEGTNGDLYLGGSNLMAGTYVLFQRAQRCQKHLQ